MLQYRGAEGEGYRISFLGSEQHVIVRSKQEQVAIIVLPLLEINLNTTLYYKEEISCGCVYYRIFQLTFLLPHYVGLKSAHDPSSKLATTPSSVYYIVNIIM